MLRRAIQARGNQEAEHVFTPSQSSYVLRDPYVFPVSALATQVMVG